MEKTESLCTASRNVNWCSHYMENNIGVLQKIKDRTTISSSNSTPGFLSNENENTNLQRFINPHAHCSTVYKSQGIWEQPKCPLMDEWIKKLCVCVCVCVCVYTHNGIFFFFFCLLRAALVAYGGSQARGQIGAAAAGLHYSHSNARSLTH